MNSRNFIISISDGSGTRKPENPTRGFFTNPNPTRTRKKYYKPDPTRTRKIANPTRKPEHAKNMYFYQNIHKVFTEKVQPKFFL